MNTTMAERTYVDRGEHLTRDELEAVYVDARVMLDSTIAELSQATEKLRVEREVNAALRRQLHVVLRGK